jgi:hypothetical protein
VLEQVVADRIHFFLPVILFLALISVGCRQDFNAYATYVKEVSNADSTINELSAACDSKELNEKLNGRFQSVSENKALSSKIPEQRIEEKQALWQECKTQPDSCDYVPEGYSFEIHRNFLNLTYQYNQFGSHDLFHKHAVIDLEKGRRMLYLSMFSDPNEVLKKYNDKYIEQNKSYLNEFSGSYLSDEEQEEFDIIQNHLETRAPFELHELNNCELVFDSDKKRFTEIRFHYNGAGGIYKAVLSEGYISFTLKELEHLLLKEFKKQLGKR